MGRWAVSLLVAAACGAGACAERGDGRLEDVVLRVGTSHGLGAVSPSPSRVGGAAFYVRTLLYDEATDFAELAGVDGRRVRLSAEDPEAAATLVESLVYEGLEEVEIAEGADVVAEFQSSEAAEHAARAFRQGRPVVETGPFKLASQRGAIRLDSQRSQLSIDAMEIISLETTELWRRLHGRDIDIIPVLDAVHRDQFEGMGSVRILELPVAGYPSLVFNTRQPALDDRSVRRSIAATLDRDAIARVACGSRDCRADVWFGGDPSGLSAEAPLPEKLEIWVLESDSAAVLAAQVIRHQLRAEGVRVTVRAAALETLTARKPDSYDALLVPIPAEISRIADYIDDAAVHPERYAEAMRSGDEALWRRVLTAEMPAVPLYEGRYFAAIDGRFCGGEPERASSWEWLADLHPCEVASR